MHTVDYYQELFNRHLASQLKANSPETLYEPMVYILRSGGKRLRPVLSLLSAELFGGKPEDALAAGMAVEYFHNFSLIHDDIMDAAPLRRGKPTIHHKWDINTGILSGDAMLIVAYRFLESYEASTFYKLTSLFSRTAIEVCEGQQYDIDFETADNVSIPDYIKMITYKTAVLVAAAMKMGAIIAGASQKAQDEIYNFGLKLGIAFQLQDDYLDAFGDPATFGKQLGGDIIENKKTFLYLKAKEAGDKAHRRELMDLFSIQPRNTDKKVKRVKEIYEESGATSDIKKEILAYTKMAFTHLENLPIPEKNKLVLRDFGNALMARKI